MPGELHAAEGTFGVRHQDREAAVRRGEAADAAGGAVRIRGVALGHAAGGLDEAERHHTGLAWPRGAPLAVRDRDWEARAREAGEEERRARHHLHEGEPGLELVGAVAHEARPALGA